MYKPEDFAAALDLLASGAVDFEPLITAVEPLERVPAVFAELRSGRQAMKILVDCRAA